MVGEPQKQRDKCSRIAVSPWKTSAAQMQAEFVEDLQSKIVQRLQSLRRSGLTHLPRIARTFGNTAVPAKSTAAGSEAQASPAESIDDAQRQLAVLARRVAACARCAELAESRTQTVFGVGNPRAEIMFIGEAPGAYEDRVGEPFVGEAGRLLNRIIAACRLRRDEVYICNILKCRPPRNRTPLPKEAANCREFLDAQIAVVEPSYIVCWGGVAAKNLLDTTQSIGKLRGRFYSHGRAKVLCTYHPSYLLRTPEAKRDVWEDMKLLMRDRGVERS